jgi:hypothetical protein
MGISSGSRKWLVCVLVVVSAIGWTVRCEAGVDALVRQSTERDQTDVAVTAYNSGIALVRDVRTFNIPNGLVELRFMDVAERVIPETVHIEQPGTGPQLNVLEQNYEYDLMSPDALLEKFIGKTVILRETGVDTLQLADTHATLLSVAGGRVYQTGNTILLNPSGTVVVPEVPDNLVARPTLTWLLNSPGRGDYSVETSYLTEGVTWRADYVAVLDAEDTMMDLSGWVTLDNRSGVGYKDATLKLVAGDVRRVMPERLLRERGTMDRGFFAAEAEPAFREEALFEYHLYDLQRRTEIKDNQTKQIALLNAPEVLLAKKYRVRGDQRVFSEGVMPLPPRKVEVVLEFVNKDAPGLGVPLPAGTVRTYKRDSEGALQFTGEDKIGHTPRDEKVKLHVGSAFDIVAERKQTDFRRINRRHFETEVQVELRNRKDVAVTVSVEETLPGEWNILEASHEHEKTDARTATFEVAVPAGQVVALRYRADVRQ